MNDRRRRIAGRTSFLWAAGAVVVLGLVWLCGRPLGPAGDDYQFQDTYYVVAHSHYVLSLGGVFAIFAGAYLALELARRGRRRTLFGALHFGFTLAGVLMMLSPAFAARGLIGVSQADVSLAFARLNMIASVGYGLTLCAQVFFVAVLIDALRPSPVSR